MKGPRSQLSQTAAPHPAPPLPGQDCHPIPKDPDQEAIPPSPGNTSGPCDPSRVPRQPSEDRWRHWPGLAEHNPDALFLFDASGLILEANQRAVALTGYTVAELRTKRIGQIELGAPPEVLEGTDIPERFSFDGLLQHKSGTIVPSETCGTRFADQGRVLVLASVRDGTAHKEQGKALAQARDQAMAASRVKSDFLASMSHEIRNPMNIILGMAELLRETPLSASQLKFVSAIENAGQVLLRLLNDILDLSRVEANKTDLRPERISPRAFFQDLGDALRIPIEQKGLEFQLHLPDNLPQYIDSDPARLQQILMNLVWNAIKFTSRGGIAMGADLVPSPTGPTCLQVFVTDTGIGIPADKQDCIFDPFIQADAAVKRQHGGTGLGLTISKRLVELMGGRIRVESRQGRGSCFSFSLPLSSGLAPAAGPLSMEQAIGSPANAFKIHRLLLVEDSRTNQELVTMFLADEPYEIISASSGPKALELFTCQSFDCILMDVEMPGMDGCETTLAMRRWEQEHCSRHTPIVMLTAHAFSDCKLKGQQAGCDSFLSKPIRKSRLIQELRSLLGATF
jgi:PAS domain S-box-containing protein